MCYFELDEARRAADNTVNCPCLNESVMHFIVMNNLLSRASLVRCVWCSISRVDGGTFSLGNFGTGRFYQCVMNKNIHVGVKGIRSHIMCLFLGNLIKPSKEF